MALPNENALPKETLLTPFNRNDCNVIQHFPFSEFVKPTIQPTTNNENHPTNPNSPTTTK